VLVDALARGEDAAGQIRHGADLELAQIVDRRRKLQPNRFQRGRYITPPLPPLVVPPSIAACSPPP
jgi:hypothetical protein